ncbi:SusD/RagB family nutrient-binding outer membrane lipoprotein [Galbibacter pacificus]|uniref:SusD/RagB family nutrient-binding outer membrane lipoprotein n=1 Tax=Galbibacter pacificus TaxID=2996052 RepID=A0ABT6FR12_9FLAO|nr:SusD/RagB family nutrient-binding outer membrane lipoprotein [Galbibacter pacificus]MDG3581823.1 SusD/RagB family nutrient-binding outer membrane lipoprotein [Galbibacter pacificus]MDG3585703.1 SusD/RagB family nutrient-binding outer membrane lipoprotein [Galbibacter pacificus]
MKKIFITVFSLILLSSCMSDDKLEDYNTDPKNPTEVEADFLFNAATKSLVDQMTNTSVNFNVYRLLAQYWTETTYIDEANYNLTNRNIPQAHWSEMYRDVLLDLTTAKEIVMADTDPNLTEADKAARIAQAEVLSIYAWQQLVDTYGNIPYSEAFKPKEIPLPVYDAAADIYGDLLARIDVAISDLSSGTGFSIDNLYEGDLTAWQRFATSLKLRLGIRLADVNPSLAQTVVESAYSTGVFGSNADNASFVYLSASNPNPVWLSLVQSGRTDFIVANTTVDFMNNLNDPRRSAYFDDNLGVGVYVGGPYGDSNTFSDYTHIGDIMHEFTTPACLIDYAEVSFYLAEAAARGWSVGGTAEEHYNNGITASFEYWGIPDVATYLANPDVAYDTAPGDWREKIGNQFWLAMYNRGFEGWTVWRKFDTPAFNLPVNTGNPVPTRYTYPVNEQNLNEVNWEAASTAIGGDAQTTKLFWDMN